MTMKSPNKRKSLTGEKSEGVTPKKVQKTASFASPGTPTNTPKKPQNKTPKSANKSGPPLKTPKSTKKGNKKQGDEEMQKFAGTKQLDSGESKPTKMFDSALLEGLTGKRRKRMLAKLRKQNSGTKKDQTTSDKTAIENSAEEISKLANGVQKKGEKKKKAKKIVEKPVEAPKNDNETKSKKKRNRKKGKNAGADKAEETNVDKNEENQSQTCNMKQKEQAKVDEESDYEVESEIKPDKVTKKLNELSDNDEDVDHWDQDEEDNGNKKEIKRSSIAKNKKVHQHPVKKEVTTDVLKETGLLKKGQSRYILFVGNLPFEITKQEITEHFQKFCKVKDVRLQLHKDSNKSRGFAYVEVTDEESYQKALSLHHTFLNRRRINVLYTHGGDKNSVKEKNEIKSKNLKLQSMRRQGKLAGSKPDSQRRCVRRAKKRSLNRQEKNLSGSGDNL